MMSLHFKSSLTPAESNWAPHWGGTLGFALAKAWASLVMIHGLLLLLQLVVVYGLVSLSRNELQVRLLV